MKTLIERLSGEILHPILERIGPGQYPCGRAKVSGTCETARSRLCRREPDYPMLPSDVFRAVAAEMVGTHSVNRNEDYVWGRLPGRDGRREHSAKQDCQHHGKSGQGFQWQFGMRLELLWPLLLGLPHLFLRLVLQSLGRQRIGQGDVIAALMRR